MICTVKLIIILAGIQALVNCQIFGTKTKQCKNRVPGKDYFRDQNSNLCYPEGVRGPCNEMMIFYQNPSQRLSNYGFCDCDQGYKSKYPCKDTPIRKRIYIPSEGRCHTVFSQGPCNDGKWLTYDEKEEVPRCVPNPCKIYKSTTPTSNQFWFYDPKRKQCFKTLTQGYCPDGFTLELIHTSQYPVCKRKVCFSSLSHGIRSSLTCQVGSRFSYLIGSCTSKSKQRKYIGIG